MALKIVPRPSADEQRKKAAIEILEEALEKAKNGEVVSVSVIAMKANKEWETWTSGHESITNAIGQIELMKIYLLNLHCG